MSVPHKRQQYGTLVGSESVDLNQKSRDGCVTQKWPLLSLFPNAREVAASAENASVDSRAPANGIGNRRHQAAQPVDLDQALWRPLGKRMRLRKLLGSWTI